MNITYDTPRHITDQNNIEEESISVDDDCHALRQSTSRDSVTHGLIAGVLSIEVSTASTQTVTPVGIGDNTSSSVERHGLE